jgi:alginate O-acetyltransferase complex protein AlgI
VIGDDDRLVSSIDDVVGAPTTAAALIVDFGVLGLFKYGNFAVDIANSALGENTIPHPDLRLPLGISFFTFQLVSYLVDVYRGDVERETSLARFATYILMFPHLIAGPIVRYAEIRNELARRSNDVARFGPVGRGGLDDP